jgi:hypothetical protein
MLNDTPEIIYELWQQGLNLEAGAYQFTDPNLRAEYFRVKETEVEEVEPQHIDEDAPWFEQLSAEFANLRPEAEKYVELDKIKRKMKDLFVSLLRREKALAYGYTVPRQAEDFPQLIPSDVWTGKIDWSKAAVKGNGLEFVAVRVLPSPARDELMEGKKETFITPPIKPVGRPTVSPNVLEAYESLKADGLIDFKAAQVRVHDQIRQWLAKQYPDRAGQFSNLAKETIRKEISDLFKSDQEGHKP